MDWFLQDLRYGARSLARRPGFTVVAVLCLALGIGATSAVFSVVRAVLLRPFPFRNSERVVYVWNRYEQIHLLRASCAVPDYLDRRDQSRVFERVAAYWTPPVKLTGEGEPVRLDGARVTAGLFPLLGVEAVLGRTFSPEEDEPGRDRVAVLTHGLWQRQFGSDPRVIGRTLRLDDMPTTVVGVLPPEFRFLEPRTEIFLPAAFRPEQMADTERGSEFLRVLGLLKPGIALAQAQEDMDRIARGVQERFAQWYPQNMGWGATVVPLREQIAGPVRPALLVLSGAVGLVLLIACANVASLLLARASAREREIAIRAALGATRPRIVRQLLTESVLLALIGGAAGLLVALWATDLLVALDPGNLPRLNPVRVDGVVLAVTLLASALTGVAFGLVPALQASRPDLRASLKEGSPTSSAGPRRSRLRAALVVSEIALALLLLTGAGLMLRSLLSLERVDPGFRPQGVLTARVFLPPPRYEKTAAIAAFESDLLREVRALPGVKSAGAVTELPLSGNSSTRSFQVEGQPPAAGDFPPLSSFRVVSPDYFRTLGIVGRQGRDFDDRDREGSPLAVIVEERLARRFWPEQDPLGRRLSVDGPNGPWRAVVGVVSDIKHDALDAESYPHVYVPYAQSPAPYLCLVVRAEAAPAAFASAIRDSVRSVDPGLPVFDFRSMEDYLSESLAQPRFNAVLLGLFAAVAALLAAAGLYGVVSYSVTQRTHEIGVRMALGARRGDVLRLVVSQGMAMALAGVGIGLAAAWASTRILSGLLFGVTPTDLATYATVSAILAGAALLASWLPARRAARVDPMEALRCE